MNIQELQTLAPSRMSFSVTDQFKNYVFSRSDRCFAAGDRERESIQTQEDLFKRQAYIRFKRRKTAITGTMASMM